MITEIIVSPPGSRTVTSVLTGPLTMHKSEIYMLATVIVFAHKIRMKYDVEKFRLYNQESTLNLKI